MPRKYGGLAFWDLNAFNLLMLGKQGWNFIVKPDALVSRLFKARYFPGGNFLDSSLGHNPSCPWRSIWSSIPLLKKGTR